MSDIPRIRNVHSNTVHAVGGANSPVEDGSLHIFFLYCGPMIDLLSEPDKWQEEGSEVVVTCRTCRRSLAASRHDRLTRALVAACTRLIADKEARPGAYLHVDSLAIDEIAALCDSALAEGW